VSIRKKLLFAGVACASVLLLVVMIGAAYLAKGRRREEEETPSRNPTLSKRRAANLFQASDPPAWTGRGQMTGGRDWRIGEWPINGIGRPEKEELIHGQ